MGEIENESPANFEDILKKHEHLIHQQEVPQQTTNLHSQKPEPYSLTGSRGQNEGYPADRKPEFEESDDEVEDIEDDFDNDIEEQLQPLKASPVIEAAIVPQAREQVEAMQGTPTL